MTIFPVPVLDETRNDYLMVGRCEARDSTQTQTLDNPIRQERVEEQNESRGGEKFSKRR